MTGVYQHFRKHEHPFVDQVLSWKEQVERTYTYELTDFLDPRERQIITSLLSGSEDEVQFKFHGGVDYLERQRAIIAPYYEEITEETFAITLLEATFPEKFITLKHRDILGSFLALGIDRKKLGDIIVSDDRFQIIVPNDLSSYIKFNLNQVNNAKVKLKEKELLNILSTTDDWMETSVTVSSLRLDVVVKEIYRVSRQDAVSFIKRNRVKVNFTHIDDPSIQLLEGDLLSVRGHGRSKFIKINGKSKKDKFRITTAKLKA